MINVFEIQGTYLGDIMSDTQKKDIDSNDTHAQCWMVKSEIKRIRCD